jgi:CRISPR-associated endoribonuclease Cas6
MRIHLNIQPSSALVSFNYQPILTSALHRWLGLNEYHDDISLYSFSWFQGVISGRNGLSFSKGGSYFISSYNNDFIRQVIEGIQRNPNLDDNLLVSEIILQHEPEFSNVHRFFTASPILIKRKDDNDGERHFTFRDNESDMLLTQTLQTRLRQAGFSDEGVKVSFDKNYHSPKTKVVSYKGIGNKVSICPVNISGTKEQIAFAWNVGIGNSTGIGFGALK